MTAPNIHGLAPLRVATTVLAIDDLAHSPDVATQPFRHSGNEFPSIERVPGAAPRYRCRTPFYPAYQLLGLKGLVVTAFDMYLAKFSAGIRGSGSVHRKQSLASGASALTYIRGASMSDGVFWAELEAVLLSSDGMTYPIANPTDGNALPTLASEPTLHTLGPASINGSVFAGLIDCSLDLGQQVSVGIDGNAGDGLLYPTVAQLLGGQPVLSCMHGDATQVYDTIGPVGVSLASNYVQYFRQYDTTTQLVLASGISLTAAAGRVTPQEYSARSGQVARAGWKVDALSGSASHPLVVGTGAVPTP